MKDWLTLAEIMQEYENITKVNNAPMGEGYILSDAKGHYCEIFDLGRGELRFIHDNFPGQRRIFNTNIPYYFIEDFERDLERMVIPKPDRKTKEQ